MCARHVRLSLRSKFSTLKMMSPILRIILYCLVYTFGLDSVKSCDVTVENDPLAPYFKQGFLNILEIYNVFHIH